MVKSSIVKKFVTLGVTGAMAISVLGASVASAYSTYYADGGSWTTHSEHNYYCGYSYGFSSYFHSTRGHSATVVSNGKVSKSFKNRGIRATASKHFYGADAYKIIYTWYNVY